MNRVTVKLLDDAPVPKPATVLQVRSDKVGPLGQQRSGIYKEAGAGPFYVGATGLAGDEHEYPSHGGIHRAVHQYAIEHYAKWRAEAPPDKADLFEAGAFGENLVTTPELNEENVCVGDIYHIGNDGDGIVLEVSEPRNPCYKLNIRFEWFNALKRIQRTGRVGWNMRVPQPGSIKLGDRMTLVKRPHPKWSVMNVQRVLHGRDVEPALLEELVQIETLSPYFHNLAKKRLANATRTYRLVEAKVITARVRQLTFELMDAIGKVDPRFRPFAYAKIKFGPSRGILRSYSIVCGDLKRFTIAVQFDDYSRGGSKYLHTITTGEQIGMAPGYDVEATEHDKRCCEEQIGNNIIIIGGIGVTAFLPLIETWLANGTPFEVHYATRCMKDAAYHDILPVSRTRIYDKTQGQRMDISAIISGRSMEDAYNTRIFCCGPPSMLQAVKYRTECLDYPEHLVHLENFGNAEEWLGNPFEVEVNDTYNHHRAILQVGSGDSLLRILNDAGFDVMSSCQAGSCGACKVTLRCGKVEHKTTTLDEEESKVAMLSCVDRGVGRIEVEVD